MAHRGAAKVNIFRRVDESGILLTDYAAPNVIYEGRTPDQNTSVLNTKWQIKKISLEGSIRKVEYADDEKYRAVWSDRATYFPNTPDNGETLPEYIDYLGGQLLAGPPQYAEVVVNATTWVELTAGFTELLQFSVRHNDQGNQNRVVRLRGDNVPAGIVGFPLEYEEERNYNDVGSTFVLYAKSESGTVTLDLEGLPIA